MKNVHFAFSTNAFTDTSSERAIDAIAEAGYDGVEIMLDAPHIIPAHATATRVRHIRQAVEKAGLTVSNCNAFPMNAVGDTWHPSWIEPDEATRQQRIDHTSQSLRIARDLGARNISTEPGGPLTRGMSRNEATTLFVQGLAEVLPVAEEVRVDILVEPEPGLLLERVDEWRGFRRRIDHPLLALNFDIGHFFCVGEDPGEAYLALQEDVRHVHLEDIAATRQHRHLQLGEGAIDIPHVVDTIAESGYIGWITVELYPYTEEPYQTAVAALKYIHERIPL
jgi:sugar phosphate isomerase/epimerase